jgi:hypothetical protein
VLFIGRSLAAPIGAGMGILLLYVGLVPLQELMVAQNNGASRTGHLTLVSPAVLFKNALGFTLATTVVPATTTYTWIASGLIVVASLALAGWIFLRAQGVETWETSPSQRWIIGIVITTLIVLPPFLADTNYEKPAPPVTTGPAIRGVFSRAGSLVGMTEPGGKLPTRCCGTILNHDEWPSIHTDERTRKDLVVLLPVDATQQLMSIECDLAGENGLQVGTDANDLLHRAEIRDYAADAGPAAPDGHHIRRGWAIRVPVWIEPTHPWDTGGMRYPMNVRVGYRVAGDDTPREVKARVAVEAQIWTAFSQMAAVALVLPLVCTSAAIIRWRRTR